MREKNPKPSRTPRAVIPALRADHAAAGEESIRRAQAFIHELSNLVDGSLRLVDLARRSLIARSGQAEDPQSVIRHLEGAHAALAHIASLVKSAYRPSARDADAGMPHEPDAPASLASAITSAIDVLTPRAKARGIRIQTEIDATARGVPADEIYAVVSNAVRNSIEAIDSDGRITVRARVDEGHVLLEVLDDGAGPPESGRRAFELGFSTKAGSSGVGLALAAEVVTELRGTIDLLPRNLPDPARPGAILRVRYPVPQQPHEPFRG